MAVKKVAIVIDNKLENSKDLVSLISDKFENVEVFNFGEYYTESFNLLKSIYLIYKIEKMDFSDFDVVYSLSTGFANGVVTNLDTRHINIYLGVPTWYFETDKTFLKHRIRNWIQYATNRAEENFYVFDWIKQAYSKLNKSIRKEEVLKQAEVKLSAEKSSGEHFVLLCSNLNSKFVEECMRIFNQTGRKLYVVCNSSIFGNFGVGEFSEAVVFVDKKDEIEVSKLLNNAKGVFFDQYFTDYEYIYRNVKHSMAVLSYRNNFINQFFNEDKVFQLNDIDSFENEFAKFVSWLKLNSKVLLEYKKIDWKKVDV